MQRRQGGLNRLPCDFVTKGEILAIRRQEARCNAGCDVPFTRRPGQIAGPVAFGMTRED